MKCECMDYAEILYLQQALDMAIGTVKDFKKKYAGNFVILLFGFLTVSIELGYLVPSSFFLVLFSLP